jgi:hypothetical protein
MKAFSLFAAAMRSRKSWVSSTLEILLAARCADISFSVAACTRYSITLGTR